jgi:uncharacterized protein YbcV (DUF1398 family)
MTAEERALAQQCVRGAHDGSLRFPEILAKLAAAGFDGYLLDYRRGSQAFYHTDGSAVELNLHSSYEAVAPQFDADVVSGLVRWAQANGPNYSYAAFCERVTTAGCAGYLVSLLGRRVLYFGRTGETHVEHFP